MSLRHRFALASSLLLAAGLASCTPAQGSPAEDAPEQTERATPDGPFRADSSTGLGGLVDPGRNYPQCP